MLLEEISIHNGLGLIPGLALELTVIISCSLLSNYKVMQVRAIKAQLIVKKDTGTNSINITEKVNTKKK